jgi:hypothetical protein
MRTEIGQRMEDPSSIDPSDTSYTALKRLYGALSGDLQSAAATEGPAAQAAYANANAVTRNGHAYIENTLSGLMPAEKIAPEAAANTALNSGRLGDTLLQSIRSQMPNAANELAAFKLRNMATATPGQATAANPTSATTFSTNLNRLSPEARQTLFSGIAPRLDALQTVAERGKETFARYGNPTGTAGSLAHLGLFTAPLTIGEAARLGGETGGTLGALGAGATASLPFVAGPILSNLTAREGMTRYLAAPVGGPGVGASRLYRAAAAWPFLNQTQQGQQ